MNIKDEFIDMSPLEKKMAKLSIKYQADFMSMTVEEVADILTLKDWYDLQEFIKNGCKDRVLH
tara:strand:- start:46 stop:234 length:189 start_codon:yes stop_codon:yes gene_type:complete